MAIAAFIGAIDVIEYLLDNGANPEVGPWRQHPLTAAACAGQASTVKRLLAHGIDLVGVLNSNNHLMTNACRYGSGEVVGLLLDAVQVVDMAGVVNKEDLLHTAVMAHKIDVITVLLERGGKCKRAGSTRADTTLPCSAIWLLGGCESVVERRG